MAHHMRDCGAFQCLGSALCPDPINVSAQNVRVISYGSPGTHRVLRGRIYPERIHVRFERGELDLNTYDSRLSRIVDHEQVVHQTDGIATPGGGLHPVDHPVRDYEERFRDVNEVWIDSILHGRPGYLTPEDMLGNAAVSVGFGAGGSGTLRLGQDGLEQC
jgi:hypothetical protein